MAFSQELQDTWSYVLADFNETAWSGTQTYVDGATSFQLSLTGGGTIDWSYVGATDTLTISGSAGTMSSTSLAITNIVGVFNIDSVTIDTDLGSLVADKAIDSITINGGSGTIGTLTFNGDADTNMVVNANVTTLNFDRTRDMAFTVNGDVGSITVLDRIRDSTIHVTGDLDSFWAAEDRGTVSVTVDSAIGQFDLHSWDIVTLDFDYTKNFASTTQVIWDGATSISGFAPDITARETVDTDADGQIDRIKITTDIALIPLNSYLDYQ